jgi:hypothetical protein
MKKIILLFVVCFVSISLAQEFPVTSDPGVFYNYSPGIFDREEINFQPSNLPACSVLELMDLGERNNSLIDIEYDGDALTAIFKQITTLWNTGKYNEALNLFRSIDNSNLKGVSIGINWKVPIPTKDQVKWGTDVRIGNRDSIEAVSFAHDKITGNLYAVLVVPESGGYFYAVNLSTDGGTTWSESALYSASGAFPIVSVSAAVVDSFCYIGYAYDGAQNIGRLRRVRTTTGVFAAFVDGVSFKSVFTLAATDSVKEVVVSSNPSYTNDRLYYAAITKSDSLKMFWNVPTGVTYNKYSTTFLDIEDGLDLSWNDGYAPSTNEYYLFGSYVTQTRGVKIFGVKSDSLKSLASFFSGLVYDNNATAIAAHNDTIMAVFNYYQGVPATRHNRYLVSYNGGSTWSQGLVGDSTLTSEDPDIAFGDYGSGIIYRYYTSTREGRFVWRKLPQGWSAPVKYTDHEPYYNKPAIEYLGNKKFGVVYLCWNSPVQRGAYFDMNDMAVGIDDEFAENPSSFNLLQNYPNPFNPSTLIRYQIPSQSFVSIKVYDALGNLIQNLVNEDKSAGSYELEFNAAKLASGVYFYRIQAGSFVQTKKMMLVR